MWKIFIFISILLKQIYLPKFLDRFKCPNDIKSMNYIRDQNGRRIPKFGRF